MALMSEVSCCLPEIRTVRYLWCHKFHLIFWSWLADFRLQIHTYGTKATSDNLDWKRSTCRMRAPLCRRDCCMMFRCTCSIPGKCLRDSCFQDWKIRHSELLPYKLNLKRLLAIIHHQQTQSWCYGELFVFRSIWPKNVKGRWIVRGKLSN